MSSVLNQEQIAPAEATTFVPQFDRGAIERARRDSLARRLSVLAHLQPLLDIEKGKNQAARAGGQSGRDWSRYDMRLLELVAFDTLAIEHGMHLEGGVPRYVVEEAIAQHAARCAPDNPEEDHREVAIWLVDRMLNYGDAAQGFDVPWVDPSREYRVDTMRVRVLYEDLVDDQVVLKADDGAISLTLVGLDLDLEDRLIANEAVMRAQIDSGRWGAAEARAEETRRLAAQYSSQIERFLRNAERDLRSVDWQSDVETKLDEALELIENRVRELTALWAHADELADEIDAADLTQATAMMGYVDQALSMLVELQQRILGARARFRAAQASQGFAVELTVGRINIQEDVFAPLLALLGEEANAVAEDLVRPFAGVATPTVVSIGDALSILLARPKARESVAFEVEELELVEVESPFERFDEATWDATEAILREVGKEPVRLSDLVDGHPHQVVLLVSLCAMRCWGQRGTGRSKAPILAGLRAFGGTGELRLDRITLPDLKLVRGEEATVELI